ncbi:MAG: phosphoribosylanthranilate isomerase [Myxococcota bacterium]
MTAIKICGLTGVDDARLCVEAGADAVGVNFWAGTPRCCPHEMAADIAAAVGDAAVVVGVFVDAPLDEVRRTLAETGIRWAQLHGDEPPEWVEALLPTAYKALRVGGRDALAEARRYPGEHLLLDALVPGQKGGTGHTFDWAIAAEVARERKLTLAGGLNPGNVAEAVRTVRPYRVDVASGVESAPGKKDPAKVRAFIEAVRGACP